jgi:Flp pilus assembly protein TadB
MTSGDGSAERGNRARHRRPAPAGSRRPATILVVVTVACVLALGPVRGGIATAAIVPVAGPLCERLARMRGGSGESGSVDPGLPLMLDLGAAALRAGQPSAAAIEMALPALSGDTAGLGTVCAALRAGADPAEAWHPVRSDPALGELARWSTRSADSGIRLAAAWEELAAEQRAQRASLALARAHRAGVYAMLPLALCFLPAFICVGVIPDVVGLATGRLVL